MNIDVYLLDENLNRKHLIDTYESLLWVERYNDIGDCELMIDASIENMIKLGESTYISQENSDMVCRIEKIELTTDKENGNYLIVTGYDIKKILNQRIIWKQTNFNGFVEDYIRKLINDNIINPSDSNRKINNFILDEKIGFTEKINQQATYDNLGDKTQEICKQYNWGDKITVNDNRQFVFSLYKGTDRSKYVIFSNDYENVVSSDYLEDSTNIKTIALVAGEGEGVDRVTDTIGDAGKGINRYELYVDARNLSKNIEYNELTTTYPNGKEVKVDGVTYYQVDDVNIAILDIDSSSVKATLTDTIYKQALRSKGEESLTGYKEVKSFKGAVEPTQTFIYKKDYFLGDIVTVENEYGIISTPRIVEIIETFDTNGYSVEPKFEYSETKEPEIASAYILTEDNECLATETGELLELEVIDSVITTSSESNEFSSKKISELEEVEEFDDSCCIPVVSFEKTKKLYYSILKEKLRNELGISKIPTKISDLTNDSKFVDEKFVNEAIKKNITDVLGGSY